MGPAAVDRVLRVEARAPAPPTLTVHRNSVAVAEATWQEPGARDPQATEHRFVSWLPARPGDQLQAEGLRLEVAPETWSVSLIDHPTGWRAVDLLPEVPVESPPVDPVLRDTALGWAGWIVLLVAAAALSRRHRAARLRPQSLSAPAALLGVLAVVIGSWPMLPAAIDNILAHDVLVQSNFDGFGSGWLLWALGPADQPLPTRTDTFSFAVVGGTLAHVFAPATAYHLSSLLGLLVSVTAAAWVAGRVLGLGPAGQLLAGVATSLGPLSGTAVTEGHGGWLLAPGLPLLLGACLHRSERPWRGAALVVGAGVLCALQSGYVAVMAGTVVVLLLGPDPRQLLRVAALAIGPALIYARLVLPDAQDGVAGALPWSWYVDQLAALPPSDVATLDTLLGAPPRAGLLLHGARHALGGGLLVGGLLVPLLRRDPVGLRLAAVGGVGLVLALGPELVVTALEGGPDGAGPLPFAWAVALAPPLALFRFPVRFLWLWSAAAGLGTARSLGWLQGRSPVLAAALGGLVLLECLALGMRPTEDRSTLASVPSATDALAPADVVLDLWPLHAPGHPLGLELKELGCWGQTVHGARLPVPCLDVAVDRAPLYPLHRALAQALVEGSEPPPELDRFAITAVAWRPDAAAPELRARISATLTGWWGAPVAESHDAGEHVLLFRRREAP